MNGHICTLDANSRGAVRSAGRSTSTFVTLAGLFVLWAFCNPFFAVDRGSLIYISRALADLDPTGVGRDAMFRLDGQSAFTVFTPLFRLAAASLGLAPATMLTVIAAMLASFLGATLLAFTIARGRLRFLIIAFAAALPAYYGGYRIFSYAEAAATPRPFAEALVLCGLAALLAHRRWLALGLMCIAALLHPIMALAGIGTCLAWLCTENRKWIVVVLALGGLALCAALLGVPPLDRAFTVVDPQWRAILVDRNPHLFPSLWPTGWIGRTATRSTTLLIAAGVAAPPVRRLFLTVLLVGYAGLAASYLLGEKLSLLLVLQAQTWRMMWLIFALATAAAALCVAELWARGSLARITLAVLALAWAWSDTPAAAVLLSLTALMLRFGIDAEAHPLSRPIVRGLLLGLVAMFVFGLVRSQLATYVVVAGAPVGFIDQARRTLALQYDYTPLAALAAAWFLLGWPHLGRFGTAALGILGAAALTVTWDQRSPINRYFDSGRGVPDLAAMIAARPGEIFWIGGVREALWWLHRPNWASELQGAGLVFSRDLALLYKSRGKRAKAFGLADETFLAPFGTQQTATTFDIANADIATFCSYPDAPAWIIAPVTADAAVGHPIPGRAWTAPIEQLTVSQIGDRDSWDRLSRYTVIACAR